MKIETFELERDQSLWEHRVEINLSESGVHPVSVAELKDLGLDLQALAETRLGYIQTNGSVELRQALVELYPGTTPEHFEVTNGTSEANFLLTHVLVEPGDEVLFQVPNYLQVAGLARSFGAEARTFRLRHRGDWSVDWEGLEEELSERTRLVYVSHPNNPTGHILARAEMERLVETVERASAWLLADEVYRGAELDGELSPSFWRMSERVLVTAGLSKAFGLPGLRIGWIVAPPELTAKCWTHHDYTTIAPAALSDLIARFALRTGVRGRLIERGRSFMGTNRDLFRQWVSRFDGFVDYSAPRAGAYAFVRYHAEVPSRELCERIRERQSVLLVPGSAMGMEHYLRFGLGGPRELFEEGLRRVAVELDRIRAASSTASRS